MSVLDPQGYFDERRILHFARWYSALKLNLGENWIDRPAVDHLFCGPSDLERGLRPYRLKTRNLKPHDTHKKEEAVNMAEQARKKLMECYRQVNASVSGK